MRSYLFIGIVALLILSLTTNFVLLKRQHRKDDSFVKYKSDAEERNRVLSDWILLHSRYSSSFKISDSAMVYDFNNDRIKLKELVKGKKLVFKFSKNNCSSCIEAEVNLLNEISSSMNPDPVLIIAQDYTMKELKFLKKRYNFKQTIYGADPSFSKLEIEKLNFPYYFVLDDALNSTMIFFPNTKLPFLSEDYVKQSLYYVHAQVKLTNADSTRNRTDIEMDKITFDFKKIKKGGSGIAYFTIKNVGKSNLFIDSILTSCQCTIPEQTKSVVEPNNSKRIKIVYDTNILGKFNKDVILLTNSSTGPVYLKIKGVVEDKR